MKIYSIIYRHTSTSWKYKVGNSIVLRKNNLQPVHTKAAIMSILRKCLTDIVLLFIVLYETLHCFQTATPIPSATQSALNALNQKKAYQSYIQTSQANQDHIEKMFAVDVM